MDEYDNMTLAERNRIDVERLSDDLENVADRLVKLINDRQFAPHFPAVSDRHFRALARVQILCSEQRLIAARRPKLARAS